MRDHGRYPTHDELQAVMERARRLRALYVRALIARGFWRLRQWMTVSGAPRAAETRRLRPDLG